MPSRLFARLLRPRFNTLAWVTLVAFAGVAGSGAAYVDAERRVEQAQARRFASWRLAQELRQSSEDLTRMVRVYVATGDARFRRYYQEVLDIREGQAPRPQDYDRVYWDLVVDDARPSPPDSAMPLLERMRQAGFTPPEMALLARSKAASDALVKTERAAMALVETDPPPSAELRLRAVAMLHDARYLQAKAQIMAPLREVDRLSDERTGRAVQSAKRRAVWALGTLAAFGGLLGLLLWNTRRHLRAVLGGPLEAVLAGISRLGRGDFGTPSPPADHADTVLGWVGKTREDLARLDAERARAAEAVQESERRFHQALDVMMEGCMLVDFGWTYLYVNEVAASHARRPRAAMIGRRMPELFPGVKATSVFAAFLDVMERRQPRRVEESYTFEDGSTHWYEFSVTPIREGIFVLSLDITERREMAQRLAAANADLERLVAQRTADLQAALDAAQQASQAKSEFLSHMSHELRTPMNAILGFSQLLLMDELPAAQRSRLEMIEQAGLHLLTLIDELLDLTRIEAGRTEVTLGPVDLSRLVDESLSLVRPLVVQRRLQVRDEVPAALRVRADAMRLRQVLVNLLSNAAKYNREGGRIELRASHPAEGVVRLSVRDTGIGISRDDLPRLFRPFERLEPLRHRVDGTGIGLALSRHLVGLMGGRIEVESEAGAGSTFHVDLPVAAGGEADAAPGDSPGAPATPPTSPVIPSSAPAWPPPPPESVPATEPQPQPQPGDPPFEVLCIEDHPQNVDVVASLFGRRPGWRLRVARTGEEGLAAARERLPDAILLDIHLPGMDGFQVLSALRADPATRAIPVVALSADAMPGQVRRGLQAGFADYLTKPLDLARLLEHLDAFAAAARS